MRRRIDANGTTQDAFVQHGRIPSIAANHHTRVLGAQHAQIAAQDGDRLAVLLHKHRASGAARKCLDAARASAGKQVPHQRPRHLIHQDVEHRGLDLSEQRPRAKPAHGLQDPTAVDAGDDLEAHGSAFGCGRGVGLRQDEEDPSIVAP